MTASGSEEAVFRGTFFDGSSSEGVPVQIIIDRKGTLSVSGEELPSFAVTKDEYRSPTPVGRTPFRFTLNSGGVVEAPFNHELDAFLRESSGILPRLMLLSERKLLYLGVCTVAAAAILIGVYTKGIPFFAETFKSFVPEKAKVIVGDNALSLLERLALEDSTLTPGQQEAVRSAALALGSGAQSVPPLRVLNRDLRINQQSVPNAFALLPNTIIVCDAAVKLLDESELEAVLAHEIGHLAHDHGTEMLLRASTTSMISLAMFGGDPGLLHAAGLALIQAQYSQAQEREADQYAAKMLLQAGKNPLALIRALDKMAVEMGAKSEEKFQYLSTHPTNEERRAALESYLQSIR